MFAVKGVRAGAMLDGFSFFWANIDTPGRIWIDASAAVMGPVAEDGGELVVLELRVKDDARRGGTMIDLQAASLNDGRYTLIPEPRVGRDGADGLFRIAAPPRPKPIGPPWFDRIGLVGFRQTAPVPSLRLSGQRLVDAWEDWADDRLSWPTRFDSVDLLDD